MTYVYDMLISAGTFVFLFAAVLRLFVWAVPRYGARALQMALAPTMAPPVIPPPVVKMTEAHAFVGRHDRGCDVCKLPDRHPIHTSLQAK